MSIMLKIPLYQVLESGHGELGGLKDLVSNGILLFLPIIYVCLHLLKA